MVIERAQTTDTAVSRIIGMHILKGSYWSLFLLVLAVISLSIIYLSVCVKPSYLRIVGPFKWAYLQY